MPMSTLPPSSTQLIFGSKGVAGTTRRSDQPRHDDLQRDNEQQHDQHGLQQQQEQRHHHLQQQYPEQDHHSVDDDDQDEDGDNGRSQVPFMSLYAVHALCTFDERMYEFASSFFIMEIFKTTLLPMSIYGFSTTVLGILFSTTVGSLVDTTPRLQAVQSFLFTQKLTAIFGTIGFWVLLTWFDPSLSSLQTHVTTATASVGHGVLPLYQGYSVFAFLVLASGVLKLSALGWSISIERDWIVALCQSDSDMLTRINVNMKRIDLVCKLVSPLVFAGLLAQLHSLSSTSTSPSGYCSLVMATWSVISFCSELVLVRRIWFRSPVLWQPRTLMTRFRNGDTSLLDDPSSRDRKRKRNKDDPRAGYAATRGLEIARDQGQRLDMDGNDEGQALFAGINTRRRGYDDERRPRRERKYPMSLFWRRIESFQMYSHHIVFLASFSYAIIYINLMSVSGTMIGYLQWRGFSATSIAFLKGICTAAELLGTVLMPIMTRYVGLVRTGAWSIWLEVVTLTPVVLSIYSDRLPIQVFIFVGMALSRVGVWSFDLVITQTMQEYIEPTNDSDSDDDDTTHISSVSTTVTKASSGSNSSSSNAGLINGWHYSMMNVFELGQFFLTMIWSDPEVYYIPCTLSFVCVVVGAVVYSMHVARMRGHLFHYQRIASAASSYLATSTCVSPLLSPGTTAADDGIGVRDSVPGPSRRVNTRRSNHEDDADDHVV